MRCPDLQPPTSGQLRVVTDGLISTAVFECAPDYYIFGSTNITCEAEGSWSALEPECSKYFRVKKNIQEILSPKRFISFHRKILLKRHFSASLYFSHAVFLFSGCNLPPLPDNSYSNVSQDGSIISYLCETGYTLNGPIEQVCLPNGSGWDTQVPNCCKLFSTTSFDIYFLLLACTLFAATSLAFKFYAKVRASLFTLRSLSLIQKNYIQRFFLTVEIENFIGRKVIF